MFDKDEDEYIQTMRQKDSAYKYFSGTLRADEDIEPASELVRRSMIIAKSRGSISIDNRLSLMDLHESNSAKEGAEGQVMRS